MEGLFTHANSAGDAAWLFTVFLLLSLAVGVLFFTPWLAWRTYRQPTRGRAAWLGGLLLACVGLGWAWSDTLGLHPVYRQLNLFWYGVLPVGFVVGELLLARRSRALLRAGWVALAVQAVVFSFNWLTSLLLQGLVGDRIYEWQQYAGFRWGSDLLGCVVAWGLVWRLAQVHSALALGLRRLRWPLLAGGIGGAAACQWAGWQGMTMLVEAISRPHHAWAFASPGWVSVVAQYASSSGLSLVAGLLVLRWLLPRGEHPVDKPA